jgi:hypothetical protein
MGSGFVNELICYVYEIAVNVAKVGGTELLHCLGREPSVRTPPVNQIQSVLHAESAAPDQELPRFGPHPAASRSLEQSRDGRLVSLHACVVLRGARGIGFVGTRRARQRATDCVQVAVNTHGHPGQQCGA